MSATFCGMNFDQYVQFHIEFLALMTQIGEGNKTDADIISFLVSHGQTPVLDEDDPESIDSSYYMSAGLKPWEDFLNQNPDLQAKKAMALMGSISQAAHGDADESSDIEIEGVTLEGFAEICAALHGGKDTAALHAKHGVRDMAHWETVNTAYQAAMATDATGRLTTHYGQIFMKYGTDHAANVNQSVADAMAQNTALLAENERVSNEVPAKVKEMALAGAAADAIVAYVRAEVKNADDDEELDGYVEPAADELAEEKQWKAVEIVLQARFALLQPGGDRTEWVTDELDSLGANDDDDDDD